MPQMAPIAWVALFFFILLLTYFLKSYLFFLSISYKQGQFAEYVSQAKSHWKW
uniref:ATP synthase F0 subunit 8 n=1 Tax=Pseudoniphargus sp. 1-Balearics TaxID=2212663 RepID=A0A345UE31_9CRUS|nr:ATP synthase F0 subunit 8 [Pseudoniphargus sp. 1-Balearics]